MGGGSSIGRSSPVRSENMSTGLSPITHYTEHDSEGNIDSNVALELVKRGIQTIKPIAAVTNPTFCLALSAAEFAITGYQQISYAMDEGKRIWNSDDSIDKKISKTANIVSDVGTEITREGAKMVLNDYVSSAVSDTAVEMFENAGIFNNLEETIGIEGLGDISKEFLRTTIDEEVSERIGGTVL